MKLREKFGRRASPYDSSVAGVIFGAAWRLALVFLVLMGLWLLATSI